MHLNNNIYIHISTYTYTHIFCICILVELIDLKHKMCTSTSGRACASFCHSEADSHIGAT